MPLKIDIGDSRVVCFNVSTRCRGNTKYFKRLGNILDHSDAPGVVIKYLLSLDISDFDPQEIPATKMKSDIMRDQLPNPIRFLIDHITSWVEDKVVSPSRTLLYQNYLEWCGENGEKIFSNNIFGKKLLEKNIIECKRASSGKREWQYILDRSKIIAKLCESGLGDMKEFSDIPTNKGSQNETTDIPIFNVPETISQKIIPSQPKKNTLLPNTGKDRKASNQDKSTQNLFDFVAKDIHVPVTSTSGTSETSKPPKQVMNKPEPIRIEVDMPPKETNDECDSSKPINELSSAILLARA